MFDLSADEQNKQKVMNIIHLAVFLFALALTVYAAFNTSDLRLEPAGPRARPFFGANSPVIDLFGGDIGAVVDRLRNHRATLVYLYAPWDRQSQLGITVMERAHTLLSAQKVSVTAVNCWLPNSVCRQRLHIGSAYPVLMLYFPSGKGVQYTGAVEVAPLLAFVSRCLRPLLRLTSSRQLHTLRTQYSTVFVGFAPFGSAAVQPSPFYHQLLSAAILWHGRQAAAAVAGDAGAIWTVVTDSDTGSRLSPQVLAHSLSVFNWDSTYVLWPSGGKQLNHTVLVDFAQRRWRPLPGWLRLDDERSSVLDRLTAGGDREGEGGGALLAVVASDTASEPTVDQQQQPKQQQQLLATLRRVWIEYSTCPKAWTTSVLAANIKNQLDHGDNSGAPAPYVSHCVCEAAGWSWQREIVRCFSGQLCRIDTRARHCITFHQADRADSSTVHCMWCQMQSTGGRAAEFETHHSSTTAAQMALKSISGVGCPGNRSLSMTLVHSRRDSALLRRLLGGVTSPVTAVIVSRQSEQLYVLSEPVTVASLAHFISRYHLGRLTAQRTYNADLIRLHRRRPVAAAAAASGCDSQTTCAPQLPQSDTIGWYRPEVLTLTALTFSETIANATGDVLLVLESAGCGHCSAQLNHALATVTHLLASHDCLAAGAGGGGGGGGGGEAGRSLLTVARIDANNNALPVHYTVYRTPAVLYLPADSGFDSRQFPGDRSVSVDSLLRFIVAHCSPQLAHCILHSTAGLNNTK